MHLFLDVDGIILNFNKKYYQVANNLFKLNIPLNYIHNNWYPYLGDNPVLTKKQNDILWDYFIKNHNFENLELLDENIPYFINKFINNNWEVSLITNIPKNSEPERLTNLNNFNIQFDRFLNAENGKYNKSELVNKYYKTLEKTIFIDDNWDNCIDIVTNCNPDIKVYVMSYPYNAKFSDPRIHRIQSWTDIINIVL